MDKNEEITASNICCGLCWDAPEDTGVFMEIV